MQSGSSRTHSGGRTGIALLALTCALLVGGAAVAPTLAMAGTVAGVTNHNGNTPGNTATGPTEVRECRTIDEPGEYRLAGNLQASSGDCLVVTAGNVSIDGAGYTVTGAGTDQGTAVVVAPSTDVAGNVAVRDLTATGARRGLRVADVSGLTLSGVDADGNGAFGLQLEAVDGATVTNSRARRNAVGVDLPDSTGITLRNVVVRNNRGPGVTTAFATSGLRVVNSRLSDNGARGVFLQGDGDALLRGLNASANGGTGIHLQAPNVTVAGATASANGEHGIEARAPGTTVIDSVASNNTGDGLRLPGTPGDRDDRRVGASGTSVLASANDGAGVRVLDATGVVLTGVTATGNGDGVVLSASDAIRVNETNASANEDRGIALLRTNDSTVRASTVLDNGGDGLRLRAADGNELGGVTASGNDWTYRATGNGRTSVTGLSLVPSRPGVPDARLSFTANDVRLRPAATPTDPGPGPGNRTFDGTVTIEATETPGQFETSAAAFAELRLSYTRADLRDPRLDEGTARLHVFDGTWSEVADSTADTAANEVSANLTDPAGTYSPVADLENAIRDCDDDPDESGTWQVVADISADTEQCLVVAADDVTVRGNAHTITGADGAGSEGVVLPAGTRNVTVRNLTVRDWETGIAVRNTEANLTRLSVRSTTQAGVLVDGATDPILFRTAVADTGVQGGPTTTATEGVGVRVVDSTRPRLIRLSVTGNTGDGVVLDGATDPMLRTLVLGGNDDWDLRGSSTTRGAIAADLRLFDPADDDPTVTTVNLPASRAVRLAAEDEPTQPADDDLRSLSRYVNLSGSTSSAFADLRVFYPDGTDVGNLDLYRDAGDTGEYVPVEGATPDRERGTIGANLTALRESQLTFAPLVDTSDSTPTDSPTPTSPDDGTPEDSPDATPTPEDSPDTTPTPTPDDPGDDDSTDVGAGSGGGGGGSSGDTDPGTGSPSFRTVDASVNRTTMRAGADLAVNATVTNEGDGFGRYDVVLYRNDRFVGSRFVDLDAGETKEITFEREPTTAGEYTFRVENVTAGTVTVSPPPETPTPSPTPTATPGTPTATTPGTPDDGEDGTPTTPMTGVTPTSDGTATTDGTPTTSPTASPTVAPTPTTAGGAGASPSPTGSGSDGIGPLGIAAGGVGVLAVGAGAAYYLLTRPV